MTQPNEPAPAHVADRSTIGDALIAVRRLGPIAAALSLVALLLGLLVLALASTDSQDRGLAGILALAAGITLVVGGISGTILGAALSVLARRAAADPTAIRGSRRIVLVAGLALAVGQVLVASVLGSALIIVGAAAAFAIAFLVVAVGSRRVADRAVAGTLAVALLGIGLVVLLGQASANDASGRQRDRASVIFIDMSAAIAAAEAAAPPGWAVASLASSATDLAPSVQLGELPPDLAGSPLRGIIVVDCAGAERVEVVTRDDGAPVMLAKIACTAAPQMATFDVPEGNVRAIGAQAYLEGIEIDQVDLEPAGGMTRAMILVAQTGVPDPESGTLVTAFVTAFGEEPPR